MRVEVCPGEPNVWRDCLPSAFIAHATGTTIPCSPWNTLLWQEPSLDSGWWGPLSHSYSKYNLHSIPHKGANIVSKYMSPGGMKDRFTPLKAPFLNSQFTFVEQLCNTTSNI